jgi:hypothetical protein
VPEPVIDVVEPFFRVLVELGYDRSIAPWKPMPAQLIPTLDPAKVTADLVNAIGEGINNALALVGAPPLLSISKPVTSATLKPTDAQTPTEPAKADASPQMTPTERCQAKTGTETTRADVFSQVTPTEAVSKTGQATSTKSVTKADQATSTKSVTKADQAALTQTPTQTNAAIAAAAGASELSTKATPKPSASPSESGPAKPAFQSATPQPLVRGSLGVGQQLPNSPHRRGKGGRPTTQTGAGAATGGRSWAASSSASSSSIGNSSRGSANGDAGKS